MNKEYSFNLNNLVNNLNGKSDFSNTIQNLNHTINNNKFSKMYEIFYEKHKKLMLELAEENIVTIADLYNYVDWIKNDE